MKRILAGLGALLALAALVIGAPLALATWWGNPWPAGGWSEVQLLTNDTIVGAIVAIGWLAWHLLRVQDDHVADVAGSEQVWTAQGFARRFALPVDDTAIGYGMSTEEVATVRVEDPALLVE